MKIVRTPAPPAIPTRKIMKFSESAPAAPPPAHDHPRASNAVAEHAVRTASSPGGIDPRQMRH